MRIRVVLRWLGANADALIALTTAAVVGILGLTNLASAAVVNSAILVTLAALALSVLRDRWGPDTEPQVRTRLLAAQQALDQLPQRIGGFESLAADYRAILAILAETSGISILHGRAITRSLEEARADAKEWIFRGGTATFVRAVVLPECVHQAQRRAHNGLNVRLEILDPRNPELCERYANFFRHGVDDPNEDERSWTGRGTQLELYATILAACWWKQNYSRLKIEVALSPTMSLWRWDMTQNHLFITARGPRFPAQMHREGSFYYDYWRNELDVHFSQCHILPLANAPILSENPTAAEARDLFSRLQLNEPEHFSDEDVDLIVRQAIHAQNPYS